MALPLFVIVHGIDVDDAHVVVWLHAVDTPTASQDPMALTIKNRALLACRSSHINLVDLLE